MKQERRKKSEDRGIKKKEGSMRHERREKGASEGKKLKYETRDKKRG